MWREVPPKQALDEGLWEGVMGRCPDRVRALAHPSNHVDLRHGAPHRFELEADQMEGSFARGDVPPGDVNQHGRRRRGDGRVHSVDDGREGHHCVVGIEQEWNTVHAFEEVGILDALWMLR